MIGRLRGKIVEKRLDWVLLDVSGVGYKIFTLPKNFNDITKDEAVFYTYLYVREDMLNLYGFLKEDELDLFEMLISISGVGPKAALGILSVGDTSTIKKAIAEGRSEILMGVSGVGRKMADRVILELKNKVQLEGITVLPRLISQEDEEVIQALVNLGYKKSENLQAVSKVQDIENVEKKVTEALKNLSK